MFCNGIIAKNLDDLKDKKAAADKKQQPKTEKEPKATTKRSAKE